MKKLTITYFALSTSLVWASQNNQRIEQAPSQTGIDKAFYIEQKSLKNDLLRQQKLTGETANKETLSAKDKELINNPNILEDVLLHALISSNKDALLHFSSLYKQTKNIDNSLIEWADAVLQKDKNLNKSISLYRSLLSNFPNNFFIRYQLAETLFYNQEYEASKSQFEKLRASSGVTEQDIKVFEQYINAINQKENWSFSFGATFLNDKNLSNSAKQGTTMPFGSGTITSGKRQEGQGISSWFGANKQWNLENGKFLVFNSNLSNRYYWDNKKYNEINGQIGLGLGYSDARLNLSFIPTIQKRWYAGGASSSESLKQYSDTYGGSISLGYWLNQNFKYSSYYNFGYDKYDRDVYSKQYDGASHLLSNSLMYFPKATQYWSLAFDASKKYAADKTNAYERLGSRLTWGQEWWKGTSTSTTLGIAKRNYKQASFLGKRQKNLEYSANFSIWHKKLHYVGFTPRITWSYVKTKSNIPIYSYDKNQVFFEVSKDF